MKREIRIFIIVGFLTVLLDYVTYRSLSWLFPIHIDIAKAIGFITGTFFSYFVNRLWTFAHQSPFRTTAVRFIALYCTTLAINVAINAICLIILKHLEMKIVWSFLVATGSSAILNFIGMKFLVFKHDTYGVAS